MIDAYTIGIRLALTDDVSAGLTRMRASLLTLDRATEASAARMRALTRLGDQRPTPSAVGALLVGPGPGSGAAPRLSAGRSTRNTPGATAGDPTGRPRDPKPIALLQHLSWSRLGAASPRPTKSDPARLRIPNYPSGQWPMLGPLLIRPPGTAATARMERITRTVPGGHHSGHPAAVTRGARDEADVKPRRPGAGVTPEAAPARAAAFGGAARFAPKEHATIQSSHTVIDLRPLATATRRLTEQIGRLARLSGARRVAGSRSAMAEPTRPISIAHRVAILPSSRLDVHPASPSHTVAPIHRRAGRTDAGLGAIQQPRRAASAPVASTMPQGQALPAEAELILDGTRFGRIVADLIARELDHPRSGYSGPDPRVSPIWPGVAAG